MHSNGPFWDRLAEFGDSAALLDARGSVVTYAALAGAARKFADALGPRRRLVFLETCNRTEALAAYLGCLLGRHAVYLYSEADRHKALSLAERYQPNVIVDFAAGGPQLNWRHLDTVDLHHELCLLMSTSGSTGSAKLVKLSRQNIQSNADSIVEYLQLSGSERAITLLRPHYSYGLSVINSHLSCGASLLLTERSVTDRAFWESFRARGCTSFAGVPYTYETLARMDFAFSDFPGFRYATQAGGRLAPDLVRRFARSAAECGGRFYVMYGQTEAAPRMAYLPPKLAADHPGCIGIAIPYGTILLLDEDGREVRETDRPGQIAYRGPNVMMGYAENRAGLATDETPHVLLTGDIACRNGAGLLYIVGRAARFVKLFGARINLDDVEADLRQAQLDCACAGNDEAIVVALSNSPAADCDAAAERLSKKYGLPRFAVHVAAFDEIPKLANGKPDYQTILASRPAGRVGPKVNHGPGTLSAFFGIVLSRPYYREVLSEAGAILGVKRHDWAGVGEIYRKLTGRTQITANDTFTTLGGDSLGYVQMSIALEEYLGRLPAGWEHMTVLELEESKVHESLF